jgi:subtilisin family serine protease
MWRAAAPVVSGSPFSSTCVAGGDDDHYHGTHVAGSIGALDNGGGVVGMARARIWSVKVLNSSGSGYTSWIVAGIDYVAANSASIEVANMSLGGSGTQRLSRPLAIRCPGAWCSWSRRATAT